MTQVPENAALDHHSPQIPKFKSTKGISTKQLNLITNWAKQRKKKRQARTHLASGGMHPNSAEEPPCIRQYKANHLE